MLPSLLALILGAIPTDLLLGYSTVFMDYNRRLSEESDPHSDTRNTMGGSFVIAPRRSVLSTDDNLEMGEMHQAPRRELGVESGSAASLLDSDGPDVSLRFPLDTVTHNLPRTPAMSREHSRVDRILLTLSSWWWWEICGCLVCILSSMLLIVFVAKIDQMSQEEWDYRLQPNTVISIITTVGKTSMMVPIAACISQLKWTEFRQPTRLSLLRSIDDASRGPWGSLVLLAKARTKVLLLPALAFLTVASVAFEPSAQQILEFPTRMALLRNASAEISVATDYSSSLTDSHKQSTYSRCSCLAGLILLQDLLDPQNNGVVRYAKQHIIDSTIITSLLQKPPSQKFNCPGYFCTWKPFTTLDICGSCQSVTDQVRRNCTYVMGEYYNTYNQSRRQCAYTFPGRALNMGTFQHDTEYDMSSSKEGANLVLITESALFYETSDKPIGRRSGITFDVLKIDKETEFEYNSPPHFDAYTIKWYWCAKTFHNLSASQGEVDIGTTSSEPLHFNADYKVDDPFGLYYDPYLIVWNTSSSSALYQTLPPPFWDSLSDSLHNSVFSWGSPPLSYQNTTRAAEVLYTADIAQTVENVASVLSSFVRNDTLDNILAKTLLGDALVTESYIHVRWQWIAIVIIEVLLATALLGASIIAVRGDPLPKASVIALLVHGLEDPDDVKVPALETSASLEESSKDVVVQLTDNGKGRFLFVNQKVE